MPCNCDHMEPSQREAESRRVAKLLVFLEDNTKLSFEPWVHVTADAFYGDVSRVHDLTAMLCEACGHLPESFFMNVRVREVRQLSEWWFTHQEVDKARIAREEAEEKKKQLAAQAMAKLSPEELEALNIKPE